MEGKKIFRSALNGFHREDVMKYIETQANEAEEVKKEYEQKNAELSSKIETLLKESEEKIKENSDLTLENQNISSSLDDVKIELDDLKLRYSRSMEKIKALEEEQRKAVLSEHEKGLLCSKIKDLETEVLAYRAEKLKIADVMLKADADAREIVENAKAEAVRMRKSAEGEALAAKAAAENELRGLYEFFRSTADEIRMNIAKANDAAASAISGLKGASMATTAAEATVKKILKDAVATSETTSQTASEDTKIPAEDVEILESDINFTSPPSDGPAEGGENSGND